MAKIDVYLRSIERFGAAGAVLTSGESVTLRFPAGDRQATQTTPHDQLVALVREVAPPAALDQIDKSRPARFDVESAGMRYTLAVNPRPGVWQVAIEPAAAAPAAAAPAAAAPAAAAPAAAARAARPPAPAASDDTELAIERGPYDASTAPAQATAQLGGGSALLDQVTQAARSARATDVFLATGAPPAFRVGSDLVPMERGALDAETVSRELGIVAPAEARAAWTERGLATFTYSDGVGRVRVTLTRDQRGPGAALRLLLGEAPAVDRLGLPREVAAWLDGRGLVLVAGASGSGKTTTLAALVRAVGEKRRRVVCLETPIEIVHTSPWISQRAVGEHVPDMEAGIAAAIREGADAVAIGDVTTPAAALGTLDAALSGHLVLATIAAPVARHAADRLLDLVPADRRDLARAMLEQALLGVVAPVVRGGGRSFEVTPGRG